MPLRYTKNTQETEYHNVSQCQSFVCVKHLQLKSRYKFLRSVYTGGNRSPADERINQIMEKYRDEEMTFRNDKTTYKSHTADQDRYVRVTKKVNGSKAKETNYMKSYGGKCGFEKDVRLGRLHLVQL